MDIQYDLSDRLLQHKLFTGMGQTQLDIIFSQAKVTCTEQDRTIPLDQHTGHVLVLLEGQVKITRSSEHRRASIHIADTTMPAVITSIDSECLVIALTDCCWVWVNSGLIDASLAWQEIAHTKPALTEDQSRLAPLVTQTNAFRKLTLDCVADAFARMKRVEIRQGTEIVHEGEKGDAYYLLDSGSADVLQKNKESGEQHCVRKLFPGDSFGEEALVQNKPRNATVRTTSDSVVLKLIASDFEELVRPSLVQSISAKNARELLRNRQAELIDCRYELEYNQYRIPGARLAPLQTLRDNIHRFSKNQSYLIYCHHERRSQAAVFLLQERGVYARYIEGGIVRWPFEIEDNDST